MPRDGSGNYSLAPGNPVVSGTLIQADWANPTLSDLASAMTDSLSRSGNGSMLVPFRNADGAVGAPGISWTNEPSSGWYRSGLNSFWYSVGNENIFRITKNGIELAPGKVSTNITAPARVQDTDPAPIPTGMGWFESDTGIYYLRYQNPDLTYTYVQISTPAGGIPITEKGQPNGVASLDATGKVPVSQLPTGYAASFSSIVVTGNTNTGTLTTGPITASGGTHAFARTGPGNIIGISDGTLSGNFGSDGTNLYLSANGTAAWRFSTGSSAEQFRVAHTASAVNYAVITGAIAGNSPALYSLGTSTNIGIGYSTKGSGTHFFYTNSFGSVGLAISHAASAVNYAELLGSAASGAPQFRFSGSDTSVNGIIATKGQGSVLFYSDINGSATICFRINPVASGANHVQVTPATAGSYPLIVAAGTDTNIRLGLSSKGSEGVGLFTNNFATLTAFFVNVASSVNYWQFNPSVAGSAIAAYAGGTSTDIAMNLISKGGGEIVMLSTSGTSRMFAANRTGASDVNSIRVLSTPTGVGPFFEAIGSDATVQLALVSKGNAGMDFFFGGGVALRRLLNLGAIANADSYLQIFPSVSPGRVFITTAGVATDIQIDRTVWVVGNLSVSSTIKPSTFGVFQNNGFYMGPGVPSNGSGANGDYFFRNDTNVIYAKVAGSWATVGGGGGSFNGTLDVTTFGGILNIACTNASNCGIELGWGATGDRYTFLDFHSTLGSDFDLRIDRLPGANGVQRFINNGTGDLQFQSNGAGWMTYSPLADSGGQAIFLKPIRGFIANGAPEGRGGIVNWSGSLNNGQTITITPRVRAGLLIARNESIGGAAVATIDEAIGGGGMSALSGIGASQFMFGTNDDSDPVIFVRYSAGQITVTNTTGVARNIAITIVGAAMN